jgi:hypothetical protein
MKWLGFIAAAILITACFFPWVTITSKQIIISGINTEGTNWGKPAYTHFVLTGLYLLFILLQKTWTKVANVFFSGMNLAWAFRNYIRIGGCEAGECPEKHTALYITLFTSIIMLVCAFAIDSRLKRKNVVEELKRV